MAAHPYGFPVPPYGGQVELMKEVYDGLAAGGLILMESPTGTGKTLVLLCSVLQWIEDHQDDQPPAPHTAVEPEAPLPRWIAAHKHRKLATALEEARDRRAMALARFRSWSHATPAPPKARLAPPFPPLIPDVEPRHLSPLRLIYASRTHSQLAQVSHELLRTRWAASVRVVTLGSRLRQCRNPEALRGSPGSDLLSERCRGLVAADACPLHAPDRIDAAARGLLVHAAADLEDAAQACSSAAACPYYAARRAQPYANVVLASWWAILHAPTREALGLDVRDAILVFDEAHGLAEAISSMHAATLSRAALQTTIGGLRKFLGRAPDQMALATLLAALERLAGGAPLRKRNLGFLSRASGESTQGGNLQGSSPPVNQVQGGNPQGSSPQESTQGNNPRVNHLQLTNPPRNNPRENTPQGCNPPRNNPQENTPQGCNPPRNNPQENTPQGYNPPRNNPQENTPQRYNPQRSNPRINHLMKEQPPWIPPVRFIYQAGLDLYNLTDLADRLSDPSIMRSLLRGGMTGASPERAIAETAAFLRALATDYAAASGVCDDGETLRYGLIAPDAAFRSLATQARAVILASGTLAPFELCTAELWGDARPPPRILKARPSFDPANLHLSICCTGPSGQPLYLTRDVWSAPIPPPQLVQLGHIVANIASVVPGGLILFFPSYHAQARAITAWQAEAGLWARIQRRKPLFIEPQGGGARGDEALVHYSAAIAGGGGATIACVIGGKLSEGVNFADDLGRCALVFGVPIPNIADPLTAARLQRSAAALGPGADPAVARAMHAVNQCIGRVRRHQHDYAAVVLVDQRYAEERFWRLLPAYLSIGEGGRCGEVFAQVFRALRSWVGRRHSEGG